MLEHFNSLFEIDKNKIHLRCANKIIYFLRERIDFEWTTERMNKMSYWLNYTRLEDNPETSFEDNFHFPYNQLPEYFRDFNLNKNIYPHIIDLGVNKRYTDYIYDKTIKVLKILLLPNFIEEEKDNYIIHNKIYGDIDIMPFMKAFVKTSEILYHSLPQKVHLEQYGSFQLIDKFITSSLSHVRNEIDNSYKENNLAVMVEILRNQKELKQQKLAS